MEMTRKQFMRSVVGAMLGTATVALVAGCGGDGKSSPADAPAADGPPTVCSVAPTATIAANHGHVLMVTAADVTAAADKTYDIMGSAGHTHSVTVTAAMFAKLHNSMTVMMTSTDGAGHTHGVTVMCG